VYELTVCAISPMSSSNLLVYYKSLPISAGSLPPRFFHTVSIISSHVVHSNIMLRTPLAVLVLMPSQGVIRNDECIYIFGGYNGSTSLADLHCFNISMERVLFVLSPLIIHVF
jgi:hypothetical protein